MLKAAIFDGVDTDKVKRSCVFEERVAASKDALETGNQAHSNGNNRLAIERFVEGLWHINFDEASYGFELRDEHREVVDKSQVKLLLNLSTVLLKRSKSPSSTPGKARQQPGPFDPTLVRTCLSPFLFLVPWHGRGCCCWYWCCCCW